jgi:hypothetical protein
LENLSWSEKVKKGGLLFGIPLLLFLLISGYFLTSSTHSLYDFPLDDAWIHRVYARSLAWGQGLSYNPGEQETGATSPLWILVTAPTHWFEPRWPNAPVVGVKLIGGLLGMGTIILAALMARHLIGGLIGPLMAASLWAIEPRLIFSSYSGMEVNLFVVLLLGLILADWSEKRRWYFLLMSLLPVSRPEGLIVLGLFGGRDFILVLRKRKPFNLLGWMWVAVPLFVWMGICFWISGVPLPLPFYQKAQWFLPSFPLLQKMWQLQAHHGLYPGVVFAVGLLLFGGACFHPDYLGRRSAVFPLLVVPVVLLLGIVASRGISLGGYYWLRYVDPADFLLMIAATIGLSMWASRIGHWGFWIRRLPREERLPGTVFRRNLPLIAVIVMLSSLPHWWQSVQIKRFHLWSDARIIHLMNVEVGRWLATHTPPHVSVGVNDAGAIRYFSQRRIIDLLGLNNKAVAMRRVSVKDLLDHLDWIALYPVWFRHYNLKVFELRQAFAVNFEDYSLCHCPSQTLITIAERRR